MVRQYEEETNIGENLQNILKLLWAVKGLYKRMTVRIKSAVGRHELFSGAYPHILNSLHFLS